MISSEYRLKRRRTKRWGRNSDHHLSLHSNVAFIEAKLCDAATGVLMTHKKSSLNKFFSCKYFLFFRRGFRGSVRLQAKPIQICITSTRNWIIHVNHFCCGNLWNVRISFHWLMRLLHSLFFTLRDFLFAKLTKQMPPQRSLKFSNRRKF